MKNTKNTKKQEHEMRTTQEMEIDQKSEDKKIERKLREDGVRNSRNDEEIRERIRERNEEEDSPKYVRVIEGKVLGKL